MAYRLAVLAIALGLASPAHAATIFSSLDDVLAQSPDVVIAVYQGKLKLHVEKTLRGKLSGDVVAAVGRGMPAVKAGTRVVAFLDAAGAWSFVGQAPSGLTLDDAVNITGFYDTDASVVTPSLVTLDQLRARLAGHEIKWRFEGPLVALADDGSRTVETRWRLVVESSETGPTTVSGLPGKREAPDFELDSRVKLEWNDGTAHPLVIEGEVTGRRGAVLLARFRVTGPEELQRVSDVAKYFARPKR